MRPTPTPPCPPTASADGKESGFHFDLDPSDPETVIARALDDAETAAAEDGTGHLYDTA